MEMKPYAQRVYDHYVSTGYGRIHRFSRTEYDLYARFFHRNYSPHLPESRDARILDLGCGPGHFLYFLREAGYRNYLGVDASKECVEICRDMNLEADQADIQEYLQGQSGDCAVIVCNELFEHLDKVQAFELADLCRTALAPAGALLVKVPNMACPVGANRSRYADVTHETGYTDHSLKTLLQVCGFASVSVYGPDIYVTRSVCANVAGRLAFRIASVWFRALELLYGIETPHLMTKSVLAIGIKSDRSS
jgi:2-polyprenyl-3-methyl-5-hydroxy-6-metoxy-1,4-benzoquinol methylase